MSRQQLMDMYQRQVNLGGGSSGGMSLAGMSSGGIITPKTKVGLAHYREFYKAYQSQHPLASRLDINHAWKQSKGTSMGSALVGGALVGGARARKGVAHCMEEFLAPSGVTRCRKFMAGPPMGSALMGGFPGERKIFQAFDNLSGCHASSIRDSRAAARRAYKTAVSDGKDFRDGVRAAMNVLGVSPSSVDPTMLRRPRARKPRAISSRGPSEAALEHFEAMQEAEGALHRADMAEAAAEIARGEAELAAELLQPELVPEAAAAGLGRMRRLGLGRMRRRR